jgi:hypothetical protein
MLIQQKFCFVGLAACAAFVSSGGAASASIVDNFNAGQPQASNIFWSPLTDIGWYYTPSVSYALTGIRTVFTQSTGSGDVDRAVVFDLYNDRPANGGTLLGGGSASSGPRGTYVGPDFAPINLIGGVTYFVGLSNILNLGVNEVSFSSSGGNAGPPGSQTMTNPMSAASTWADSNGLAQFGTQASGTPVSSGPTWFDKPVMEFLKTDILSTPEPSTVSLLLIALLAGAALVPARLPNKSSNGN